MRPADLQMFLSEHSLSQRALADLLRISPQTPMRWLSGDTPIPTGTALLLRAIEGRHFALETAQVLRRLYEAE